MLLTIHRNNYKFNLLIDPVVFFSIQLLLDTHHHFVFQYLGVTQSAFASNFWRLKL
jgi:hypothetical protein